MIPSRGRRRAVQGHRPLLRLANCTHRRQHDLGRVSHGQDQSRQQPDPRPRIGPEGRVNAHDTAEELQKSRVLAQIQMSGPNIIGGGIEIGDIQIGNLFKTVQVPQPLSAAGNPRGKAQDPVARASEDEKWLRQITDVARLRPEDVHVQIGRDQHHARHPVERPRPVPQRHLSQGFHCQKRAHGMGDDHDLVCSGSRDFVEKLFEPAAGKQHGFPIMQIAQRRPA